MKIENGLYRTQPQISNFIYNTYEKNVTQNNGFVIIFK